MQGQEWDAREKNPWIRIKMFYKMSFPQFNVCKTGASRTNNNDTCTPAASVDGRSM